MTIIRRIHLLCNAHLDPCWLWEWEEGAGEAISTFHTAVKLCSEFENFIFNHNEAILYKWIEKYAPELFENIRKLVKQGKWHIMGGWFLQPDCNMPSGESIIRQILIGKNYFKEKFGVEPTTATNFDPFGHSRGLVQILKKSGYNSYLFGRPHPEIYSLPKNGFIWVGYDGSKIIGYRFSGWYNAPLGKAREKVEKWITENPDSNPGLVLWGVGNHGGGPSKKDCTELNELILSSKDVEILHSTPEQFFKELIAIHNNNFQEHTGDLNPWAPGCYTSQIIIKQKHRELENEFYSAEKMASATALLGILDYPQQELQEALEDLLFAEFHDILPGSSIPPVEQWGLKILDHGLKIVREIKAKCFFHLCKKSVPTEESDVPMFAYNPHPFPLTQIFETEFCLPDFNFEDSFVYPELFLDGEKIPSQIEKEHGNVAVDWRKRIVFKTTLPPSQIVQFVCKTNKVLSSKPSPPQPIRGEKVEIKGNQIITVINTQTGFLDSLMINNIPIVKAPAIVPIVIEDNEDPWGSEVVSYKKVIGSFTLAPEDEVAEICGVKTKKLHPLRIIEDGEVRTTVEAVFKYNRSYIITHYKIPKDFDELEINLRVFWFEKDKMLKLSIPTPWDDTKYLYQVMFGKEELRNESYEIVSQKWVCAHSPSQNECIVCINDGIYGSDFEKGTIRLTLLHSPAYSALPFKDRPLTPQDRFTPRMEQGERNFKFWLTGGKTKNILSTIDNRALSHNEKPFFLSFNPHNEGKQHPPAIIIENPSIVLSALKKAENNNAFIIRLFEPTGEPQETKIKIPPHSFEFTTKLNPFEIKSYLYFPDEKKVIECDLMENHI